jgi:hypothetical protein
MRKKSPSKWVLKDLPLTSRTRPVQAYLAVRLMHGHFKIGLDLLSGKEKPLMMNGTIRVIQSCALRLFPILFPAYRTAKLRTTYRLVGKVRADTMFPQQADKI